MSAGAWVYDATDALRSPMMQPEPEMATLNWRLQPDQYMIVYGEGPLVRTDFNPPLVVRGNRDVSSREGYLPRWAMPCK